MSKKKNKENTVLNLIKALGKEPWLVAKVITTGGGTIYGLFHSEGVHLYKFVKQQPVLTNTYAWEDFTNVSVDYFAIKTVFSFTGIINTTIVCIEKGKELTSLLKSNTKINVNIIDRPFWRKILGFRSRTKWKMVVATLVYLAILGNIVSPDDNSKNTSNNSTVKNSSQQVSQNNVDKNSEKQEQQKLNEQLTFTGKMSLLAEKGKVTVNIDTNVPNGGIFELALMNGNLDLLSDYVTAKDGKVIKEFSIPKEWQVGYLASTAMFRFNLPEHPQPENIKAIYGEKGEKMLGILAKEHSAGGKNGIIDTVSVAYPDEVTVKNTQVKLFKQSVSDLIKTSKGVIVSIKPAISSDDWSAVQVTVSDSWYYSAEYEKERFAEQMQQVISTLVKNSGLVKENSTITVFFYDTYGKELASPKMFGGYKILR